MLFVSIFSSDRARDPELWTTIWQGNPPPSINLIGAYNLGNEKRVFIWEGESNEDLQFMDRFNEVGVIDTSPAFDRTMGWKMAFAKDIEGFRNNTQRIIGNVDRQRVGFPQLERAIDLRSRGMYAPNRDAARAEAIRWQEEQRKAEQ